MPTQEELDAYNKARMKKSPSGSAPYPMPTYKPGTGPKLPIRDTKTPPSTNLGTPPPGWKTGPGVIHLDPREMNGGLRRDFQKNPPVVTSPGYVGSGKTKKIKTPRGQLGPPQVLYGPNGPPGLNKPPGSRRAIGKGLGGAKGKALLAELAKKKLKMRREGG